MRYELSESPAKGGNRLFHITDTETGEVVWRGENDPEAAQLKVDRLNSPRGGHMPQYIGANAPYYATPIEAEDVASLPDASSGSLLHEEDERERNRIRAEFAIVGVKAYAQRVGMLHHEPIETCIGDLLSDLRHLCDALNLTQSLDASFNGMIDSSERRYEEEINGEP